MLFILAIFSQIIQLLFPFGLRYVIHQKAGLSNQAHFARLFQSQLIQVVKRNSIISVSLWTSWERLLRLNRKSLLLDFSSLLWWNYIFQMCCYESILPTFNEGESLEFVGNLFKSNPEKFFRYIAFFVRNVLVLISWDGGRLEIFFFRRFPDFNNDLLLRSLQQLDHVLYQVSRKPRNFSENLLSQQWGTVHVSCMFFKNEDTNCIINHVWHNNLSWCGFIFFHQPFVQQIFDGQFYCENKWGGCRELL